MTTSFASSVKCVAASASPNDKSEQDGTLGPADIVAQ
jgi:hypothetical protein